MKTFQVYPLDGEVFTIELADLDTVDGATFKIYSGSGDNPLSFVSHKDIVAMYQPNEPPTDVRLGADQPRLFKVYLRNHTKTPLEIHAHYFTILPDTLEFRYRTLFQATMAGTRITTDMPREEKVEDVSSNLQKFLPSFHQIRYHNLENLTASYPPLASIEVPAQS